MPADRRAIFPARNQKGSGFRFFSKLFHKLGTRSTLSAERPDKLAYAHRRPHVKLFREPAIRGLGPLLKV
jgi:hypothetical protein